MNILIVCKIIQDGKTFDSANNRFTRSMNKLLQQLVHAIINWLIRIFENQTKNAEICKIDYYYEMTKLVKKFKLFITIVI